MVARLLVGGHRVLVRAAPGGDVVQGGGQQLGIAERVVDPHRRDRVLVVAGVADERPARAVRLAEPPRQLRRADELRLAPGAVHPLGELGDVLDGREEGRLDVRAVGPELLDGPGERDDGEVVVGRDGGPPPAVLGPHRGVEALGGQVAPVGVVHRQVRSALVVRLRPGRLGHHGVPAVGADDHRGVLGDRASALAVPADARHRAVGGQDLVDGEALAQLRGRLDRGVDQERVQDGAARAVAVPDPVDGPRRAGDRQRPEVERVGVHGRAPGLHQAVQQPPALERRDPGRVHEVRRHRVAREGRLVEQQDPMALARQQHRGRRPRAAGPDHDRVVPAGAHVAPPGRSGGRSHDPAAVARQGRPAPAQGILTPSPMRAPSARSRP